MTIPSWYDRIPAPDAALEDLTVGVYEGPVIGPDHEVLWQPVYWEIRNSAMGVSLVDGYRLERDGPWLYGGSEDDGGVHTAERLLMMNLPAPLVSRLEQKIGGFPA